MTANGGNRKWRGVRTIGGEFELSNLSISVGDDGEVTMGPPRVRLRTDMWPFWLEDAVEAAQSACEAAAEIPQLLGQLDDSEDQTEQTEREIDRLMVRELRSTMRAITASAFAIDGLYASVKERCGPHPHDETWRRNGTSRKKRITETFRYHLRIQSATETKHLKSCVAQVFMFRDWAVHMGAEMRDPVYREDLQSDVDWHFAVFRRENAVNAVGFSVAILDYLVSILDRGGEKLATSKLLARERMDTILEAYEQAEGLTKFQRIAAS